MEFKLTFSMDNAAFGDEPGIEAARILQEIAAHIEENGVAGLSVSLFDINGNKVGKVQVSS